MPLFQTHTDADYELLMNQLRDAQQISADRQKALDRSTQYVVQVEAKLEKLKDVKTKFNSMKAKRDVLKDEVKAMEVERVKLRDDVIGIGNKNKLCNKLLEEARVQKAEVVELNITLKQQKEKLQEQNAELKYLMSLTEENNELKHKTKKRKRVPIKDKNGSSNPRNQVRNVS